MYRDKMARVDRTASIVVSLVLVALVIAGVVYAVSEFNQAIADLKDLTGEAGQVLGRYV